MADVIVPGNSNTSNGGNGMGFFAGIVVLVVFLFLILFYGLPYLRGGASNSTPQINVPGKVDVNVNHK